MILALHDSDSVRRESGADYRFRSATLLRTQVVPPLNRNKNFIDKGIRLLLQKDGPSPKYIPESPWRTNVCPQSVEHLLRQIFRRNDLQGDCPAPLECSLAAA